MHRLSLPTSHPPRQPRPRKAVVAAAVTAALVGGLTFAASALPASAAPDPVTSGTVTLGKSDGAIGQGLVGATKAVSYAGVSFKVPASWPVYDLATTPSTCVRFDRNAVYLGTPSANQNCPAHAVGRTEALLVQPAAAVAVAARGTAATLGVVPQVTATATSERSLSTNLTDARLTVTASFDSRSALARDVVASATKTGDLTAPAIASTRTSRTAPSQNRSLSDPATYPVASTATFFKGYGFDTCNAPTTAAMAAWKQSSYRSIGIYIGGVNRACQWGNLSPSWVSTVAKAGWRMQPIYVGLQPSCTTQRGMADISSNTTTAKSQGKAAATDAVKQAKALGFVPGSVLYNDIENYDTRNTTCVNATMAYLDTWTRTLHDLGFSSGVYSSGSSGIADMGKRYSSTTWAAPDVVWTARWDGKANTVEPNLTSKQWANHQRAKQYRGDHKETWGGVTINIDSNYLDTSVASATYKYTVKAGAPVNTRKGPSTTFATAGQLQPGTSISVICQITYSKVDGDPIWNKLADGRYISDRYVSTPSATGFSAPIPACSFAYRVSGTSLNMRSAPSLSATVTGNLAHGSTAAIVCQRSGSKVGTTSVWNKLTNGSYVSDAYLPTPGKPGYTTVIPRCL